MFYCEDTENQVYDFIELTNYIVRPNLKLGKICF